MSARILLTPYTEIDGATAAALAADPNFGLTSAPAGVRHGLLELGAPGARNLASFWPDGDRSHRVPAGDEQLAAEWAAFAAIVPRSSVVEIALGLLGHRDPHWRLVDVTQIGGEDVRAMSTLERHRVLLDLYRAKLPDGRWLRLARQELASLVTADSGKAAYAFEGPGRTGDRLAFRGLTGPYEEPWLVAPVGWTSRRGANPVA